jgi:hypothetical protein
LAPFAPSFGLTVKKPSSLPCCFAASIFASLAAPALTRSSLRDELAEIPLNPVFPFGSCDSTRVSHSRLGKNHWETGGGEGSTEGSTEARTQYPEQRNGEIEPT